MTEIPEERWVAHGLVLRRGRVLFIRRNEGRYLGGRWDVPGGQLDAGESPAEAAVRELREETGLSGVATSELTHFRNLDTEGRAITFNTVTFRLRELDPDRPVRLEPREHSEYRWSTFSEAVELQLVWHVRDTLDQVFGAAKVFRW